MTWHDTAPPELGFPHCGQTLVLGNFRHQSAGDRIGNMVPDELKFFDARLRACIRDEVGVDNIMGLLTITVRLHVAAFERADCGHFKDAPEAVRILGGNAATLIS